MQAFVKIDRNPKQDLQNVDPFDQMLNPAPGGQPGSCHSLQQSTKRLLQKPRNLNRKDQELNVEDLTCATVVGCGTNTFASSNRFMISKFIGGNEDTVDEVKAQSKFKKLFSVKRQQALIYILCLLVLVSLSLLTRFVSNSFAAGNIQLYEYTFGNNQFLTLGSERRSMAQIMDIEHVTQENYSLTNSSSVSVVFKSDSIFEKSSSVAQTISTYIQEYLPKPTEDLKQCDLLLSSSEHTVDSRGIYCSLDDIDPDTNCCAEASQ